MKNKDAGKSLTEKFARAKDLCDAATGGEWTFEKDPAFGANPATHTLYAGRGEMQHGLNLLGRLDVDANGENNLAFICAAREILPQALDHIKALESRLRQLEKEQMTRHTAQHRIPKRPRR
jgi:hypothetical protein